MSVFRASALFHSVRNMRRLSLRNFVHVHRHLSGHPVCRIARCGVECSRKINARQSRGDGLRNPRAVGAALITGCFIAAYSLLDELGARIAGTAVGYIAWLTILNAIVFSIIICIVRPAALKAAFTIPKNAVFRRGLFRRRLCHRRLGHDPGPHRAGDGPAGNEHDLCTIDRSVLAGRAIDARQNHRGGPGIDGSRFTSIGIAEIAFSENI